MPRWYRRDGDCLRRIRSRGRPQGGAQRSAKCTREDAAEQRARLLREAQALGRLHHPNVVSVYDVGEEDGAVFVAMEFFEGSTLADWLAVAPRSPEEILQLFRLAGRGLAAAHAAGLVHRDFKPDNVLVGEDGRVCVTDFGLATELPTSAPAAALSPEALEARLHQITRDGDLVERPRTCLPSSCWVRVRRPAAINSPFCVALHEALEGARPFTGASLAELQASIERGPPPMHRPGLTRKQRRAIRRGALAVSWSSAFPRWRRS